MTSYEILKWILYSILGFLFLLVAGLTIRMSIGLGLILGFIVGLLNAIHSDLLDLKEKKDV